MLASEIVEQLQKIILESGDAETIVTGCYGSSGDIEEIRFESGSQELKNWYGKERLIFFGTNLCSG